MPSFDIVSSVDSHEVTNAVDQANREVNTRFDFKGTHSRFELANSTEITLIAPTEFQVNQMADILRNKLSKRQIDIRALAYKNIETNLSEARQKILVQHGIDGDLAKKIIKRIKADKLKVQAAIQGERVRITGKKRDDLQTVINLLKEENFDLPLQYENFRD